MRDPNLLFKTKLGFIYDGEFCMVILTDGTKLVVVFGCLKAVHESKLTWLLRKVDTVSFPV